MASREYVGLFPVTFIKYSFLQLLLTPSSTDFKSCYFFSLACLASKVVFTWLHQTLLLFSSFILTIYMTYERDMRQFVHWRISSSILRFNINFDISFYKKVNACCIELISDILGIDFSFSKDYLCSQTLPRILALIRLERSLRTNVWIVKIVPRVKQ